MQSRVINIAHNIIHSWDCTECEVSGKTGGTEALTTHMLLAHTLPGSIQIDKVKKEESPDRWILLSILILCVWHIFTYIYHHYNPPVMIFNKHRADFLAQNERL